MDNSRGPGGLLATEAIIKIDRLTDAHEVAMLIVQLSQLGIEPQIWPVLPKYPEGGDACSKWSREGSQWMKQKAIGEHRKKKTTEQSEASFAGLSDAMGEGETRAEDKGCKYRRTKQDEACYDLRRVSVPFVSTEQ